MKEAVFDIKNIKAIIGLGNPGQRFIKTRHNIGFIFVDKLSEENNGSWREGKNLLHSEIMLPELKKLLLIKPTTFMNDSGSVLPFMTKKGIKLDDILVIHDELEKPFGTVLFKFGGSAKGHNGLRSIIQHAGADFWRLRFGIGRPEHKEMVGDYVLSNFSAVEKEKIDTILQQSLDQYF
ncbi:aminoacyl-tRNA hydrolase [Candidatus Babeliales bacterium]|nr:aminoacyl-tRNA hydrolase [Candidatus Babeliales bacterium]